MTTEKKKIGILGASGYAGAELARLLLRHPGVDIALLGADRRAGQRLSDVFPQFAPYDLPSLVRAESLWGEAELALVFCALPHATTQEVLKRLFLSAPHTRVIDLSADFRLQDPADYERWYGHKHQAQDLQKEAVYGLTEVHREEIRNARLVANPGCYTTCALLPIVPLLKARAIEADGIVIDAKSGTTGSGRSAREDILFSEVSEGIYAYGVGHHRHMAEFDQEFTKAAGEEVLVTFTPHMAPMNRGIFSTIYLRTRGDKTAREIHEILQRQYGNEPFVQILPFGKTPGSRHVRGSNMTFIGVVADRKPGHAIIVSTLDNLMKGASGQAVQNMNLMLGFSETTGIDQPPL
jgi:N-acetyl-gamma-glutamyl-phosphate reductase